MLKINPLRFAKSTVCNLYLNVVPPSVTFHPESKVRMPGQSVTFCCNGQGNPPPEIEW